MVTGASAGIGAAFARALAARGHRLILTARRSDRLHALADELQARHDATTLVIPADLAEPHAAETLVRAIEAAGWQVDWLVNNAGYGLSGTFEARDWTAHDAFLRVMVEAPIALTHRLLPPMRARGYGRIINVASLAGFLPGSAGQTLYGPAKALLVRFSESLAAETAGSGVHVCALCPGFTYSEFHDVSGTRAAVSRLPPWLWQTADAVAAEGIAAVEAGQAIHVPGAPNRAIRRLAAALPLSWASALARRGARRIGRSDALNNSSTTSG